MSLNLFYEHVTVLDYASLDKHMGVVGDSLVVNVEFLGTVDLEGVIYDFSLAKKKVKEIIDEKTDHRLVVPKGLVKIDGKNAFFEYQYGKNKVVKYWSPAQAICEVESEIVDQQSIKSFLEKEILNQMPNNIIKVNLEFISENSPDNSCYFNYTHGLKQHYGNCQRLLHGHRSTVKVYFDDKRDFEIENFLVKKIFNLNVHFASWENIINKNEIIKASSNSLPEGKITGVDFIRLEYESKQGFFKVELPALDVYILQTETTVELLSQHFVKIIRGLPDKKGQISVKAFEGIGKGALTTD